MISPLTTLVGSPLYIDAGAPRLAELRRMTVIAAKRIFLMFSAPLSTDLDQCHLEAAAIYNINNGMPSQKILLLYGLSSVEIDIDDALFATVMGIENVTLDRSFAVPSIKSEYILLPSGGACI
jgi:hypothetical protein